MLEISNSVGTGGVNQPTDVAAVEALLCIVTTANGRPYMSSYDGAYAPATGTAIVAFQQNNGIVPRPGAAKAAVTAGAKTPAAVNPAAANGVKDAAGLVNPQGPTIAKLNQMLPHQYGSLNILPGGRTVYSDGSGALAATNAAAIRADGTLDSGFRADVGSVVDAMYSYYNLTMGLCGPGGLRSFQEQFHLATTATGTNKGQPTYATGAGPGESNHNFGMAVDLGFIGFKWLGPNATWISETPWLKKMQTTHYSKFEHFWLVRNGLIPTLGLTLYDTLFAGDFVHLQNFDDKTTNMRHSLAQLLNTVGSMKWSSSGQIYSCDFGLGGASYPVGKSEEIWDQKATVTAATLTKAWKATGKTTQAKAQDETDMKRWLREELDRAEDNRSSWVAVP